MTFVDAYVVLGNNESETRIVIDERRVK